MKAPAAPTFTMPHRYDVAEMLRTDLSDARSNWLAECTADSAERLRREQSDFLAAENHEGQRLDFHALRHTCGAWLAIQGAHPKLVQTVMRHSTITLTMDTYGHLFPGQEAAAIASMAELLSTGQATEPDALQPTGTDDTVISLPIGQALADGAQRAECEPVRQRVKRGDAKTELVKDEDARKSIPDGALSRILPTGVQRRARDSNPQLPEEHLNSNQAASQFAYPPHPEPR